MYDSKVVNYWCKKCPKLQGNGSLSRFRCQNYLLTFKQSFKNLIYSLWSLFLKVTFTLLTIKSPHLSGTEERIFFKVCDSKIVRIFFFLQIVSMSIHYFLWIRGLVSLFRSAKKLGIWIILKYAYRQHWNVRLFLKENNFTFRRLTDANFLAINFIGKEDSIRKITRRVRYPVIQDTKKMNAWEKLKGKKDDMYILNRCGKVVLHMPARRTFMLRPYAR